MKNPSDIFPALGSKFVEPRQIQEQLLSEMYPNLGKLNMLEAATGIGKSPLALCLGEMMESPLTVVATATISLQNQYDGDFPNALRLVGRANFNCERAPVTAAEAPCVADPSIVCDGGYHQQEMLARQASTIVTNYALCLSELLHGRRWHERRPHLLVCDEGHRLLDFLSAAETVRLDTEKAHKLGLKCPEIKGLSTAKLWCEQYIDRVHSRAYYLMSVGARNAKDWVGLMRQMDGILAAPSNLVETRVGEVFEATPIWPKRSAKMLLDSADHVLVMSATLWGGEFFAELLGYKEKYQYFTAPSPFESWRWPVYYRPVVSLNKDSTVKDWEKIGEVCHDYMHSRSNDKGIVHVASTAQADRISRAILRCPSCRGRLVLNRRGYGRAETIDRFRVGEHCWLVHPSVGEGESFDDEQCRIQLIAKVRYPDLGDPLVALRAGDKGLGQKFYFHSTAAYTAQTVGRGMRHEGDYCETFILDGSFSNLYDRNRQAFPLWFQRQLR